MAKFIRIILGIVLVIAAVYFLFIRDNSFEYKIPNLDLGENKIVSFASTTVKSVKNKVSDAVSGIAENLWEKTDELISSAVQGAKNYAFGIFRDEAQKRINELGQKIGVNAGIDINSSEPPPSTYITYSVKKNVNAYFTIKNSEADLLTYEVDWLDGKIDSGKLTKKDESALLLHKWSDTGEYLISFKIADSSGEKIYKVLISVF